MNIETADIALAISPLELQRSLAGFPAADARSTCAAPRPSRAIPHVIPGALQRAPEAVADWARELEPWRPVVVYCVHGHDVGRGAAAALRERGFAARHLEGGLEAWRAAGGRVVAACAADALGHARAAEDRPHRVPVADPALHRSVRAVLLRAERRGARVRGGATARRRTTSRTSTTRTTGRAAASTRSSAGTTSPIPRSATSPSSCAARTPARSISPRRRQGSSPCRSDCRRRSPTTTRCCVTACSSTTRSTRGAARRAAKRTDGTRRHCASPRRERSRADVAAAAAHAGRSVPLLAAPGLHQLRRPGRADRAHASRTRRREALDLRAALPARAQLLHGAARARGDAARDLHRLAAAPDVGRHRRRRAVRAAVARAADRAVVAVRRVRRRAARSPGSSTASSRRSSRSCCTRRGASARARCGTRCCGASPRSRSSRSSCSAVPFPAIVLAAAVLGHRGRPVVSRARSRRADATRRRPTRTRRPSSTTTRPRPRTRSSAGRG